MSSTTVIRKELRRDGVLADPYSVKLSDPDGTYGVRRSDTGAVVVSDDTDMTQAGTGVYEYSFADPAADLTYQYYLEVVWNAGETPSWIEGTQAGGGSGSGNLYTLKPLLIPYLPGCGDAVLEQQLRQIARDFCHETELWKEQLELAVVADQQTYALASAYDADVWRIRWVLEGDADTVPDPMVNGWGSPLSHTYDPGSGKLILDHKTQNTDNALAVGVRLLPRLTCASYPDWMLDLYGPVLAAGVRFACMAMADKPWTNKDGAEANYHEWTAGVASAKAQSLTRHTTGPVVVARSAFY